MGNLFDQPPREIDRVGDTELLRWVRWADDYADKEGYTLEAVIEAKKALEMERANNLAVRDGDAKDEQLGGFGDLLRELIACCGRRLDGS